MKSARRILLPVMFVAALAFAGCGGSDDDSSSDESITKTEFVTQANAICADSNATIDAAEQEVTANGQPSQADIDSFIEETLIPEVDDQLSQIRDLGVPEGEEEQVDAILSSAESAVEEAKSDPASLSGGSDPFAEANQLAAEYGLTECAG